VSRFDETGITNLGPVPAGMTFLEATIATRDRRKYQVDYYVKGTRLTICDTLRHMRRIIDTLPASDKRAALQEYTDASINYAKCMDARLKELKSWLESGSNDGPQR
jgi:hypothetical protein